MDHFAELLNLEEDVLDAGRLVDRYFQVPELVIEVPQVHHRRRPHAYLGS